MTSSASIAPRRTCKHCGRSIAVVAGKFARHDPSDRGSILLSCDGSLKPAPLLQQQPDRYGTHSLFELVAEYAASEANRRGVDEQTLFGAVFQLAA
jgi:hypothetical protein